MSGSRPINPKKKTAIESREQAINALRNFFNKIYSGNAEQTEQMVSRLVAMAVRPNRMIGTIQLDGLNAEQAKFVRREMQLIKLLTQQPKQSLKTQLEKEVKLISSLSFFKEKKEVLSKFEAAVNDLYQCIYINKECWGKKVDENRILGTLLDIALAPDINVSSIDKMGFPPKLELAFVDFIKRQLKIIAENPPQGAIPLNKKTTPKNSQK